MKEGRRKALRPRAVEADLRWLRAVIRWGTLWKTANGAYLLREDPTRGFSFPPNRNPRRPMVTEERYQALLAVADQVKIEVIEKKKRKKVPSYLPELLVFANGTGRRISAICQLRFEDLLLDRGPDG